MRDFLHIGLGSIFFVSLSPLMMIVAVLIKMDTAGPVLFIQDRYGLGGKLFKMVKFRTILHHCRDPLGARQSFEDDVRVTPVGRWLRLTSLDELPQLWNVVMGEMYLVGPRPHPVGMLVRGQLPRDLVRGYFRRYQVKPGITGFAQISGLRGALRTREDLRLRIKYDLWYVRHRSYRLDVMILITTICQLVKSGFRATTGGRREPATNDLMLKSGSPNASESSR